MLRGRNNDVAGRGTTGREDKSIFREVSTPVRTNHFPFHDGKCLIGWQAIALGAQYASVLLHTQNNLREGKSGLLHEVHPCYHGHFVHEPIE